VVPTTSTIASHLPRAVGLAYAIEQLRAKRVTQLGTAVGPRRPGVMAAAAWPSDAIVLSSFGDASVNHAVAQAAFNTAAWFDHSGGGLRVLFVCEDNGIGVSVRSPHGWVETTLRSRPGLRYVEADGCDLPATYDAAAELAGWVREHRRPAVL